VRLRVDTAADALYLRLDDSEIAESVEVVPGVVLDYNAANDVVGVGMLHLSARSQTFDASELHFERVEGLSARPVVGDFWTTRSLAELAEEQGVDVIHDIASIQDESISDEEAEAFIRALGL